MQPILRDSHFATKFLTSGVICGATYLAPARYQYGGISHWEVNWSVATAAALYLYVSNTPLGTTTYGMLMEQGTTASTTLHRDEFNVKASTYINFALDPTCVLNWMTLTERIVW